VFPFIPLLFYKSIPNKKIFCASVNLTIITSLLVQLGNKLLFDYFLARLVYKAYFRDGSGVTTLLSFTNLANQHLLCKQTPLLALLSVVGCT